MRIEKITFELAELLNLFPKKELEYILGRKELNTNDLRRLYCDDLDCIDAWIDDTGRPIKIIPKHYG